MDADELLPHNLELEQMLLGVLLHDNALLEKVSDFLRQEHFFDPLHGRVFHAIHLFSQRGSLASPVTLKDFFHNDPALDAVGGARYLAELGNHIISLVNTESYGRQIHDLYLRRQLVLLGQEVTQQAGQPDLDNTPQQQIEQTEKKLFDLASLGEAERGFLDFSATLTQAIQTATTAFQRDSHVVGLTTGLYDLDKQLGGLHPSDLVIIAGRPSMGKTVLATNIAFNAAKAYMRSQQEKKKVPEGGVAAFFSLEMSAEQLATRLLGQEVEIPSDKIRRGAVSDTDFPKFVEASRRLADLPMYIDDTPGLTVAALRTRARRLARQKGLHLIVIDYLQLLSGGGRSENRVQELSEITRSLKQLAKELNVPVVAASQLSRSVEQREDHRPMLADLRESGSIEQDADVVMFLYREEYYLSRKKPPEGSEKMEKWQQEMSKVHSQAEVIISKQRHGPIGTVQLHFNGMLTKFSNHARS